MYLTELEYFFGEKMFLNVSTSIEQNTLSKYG